MLAAISTAWLTGAAETSVHGGKVLYSPDLKSHPTEEAGYPRLIRLAYAGALNGTLLATFAHAGGTVPYLAGRFGIIDTMGVIPGAEDRSTAADTFRTLYWDTALSWGDPVLRLLRDVVGLDHVVFGSDYPYLRRDLAVSCREHIATTPVLTDAERTAVLGATAATLIPRLATVLRR